MKPGILLIPFHANTMPVHLWMCQILKLFFFYTVTPLNEKLKDKKNKIRYWRWAANNLSQFWLILHSYFFQWPTSNKLIALITPNLHNNILTNLSLALAREILSLKTQVQGLSLKVFWYVAIQILFTGENRYQY